MSKIKIDDKEYTTSELNEYSQKIIRELHLIEAKLTENKNMRALLTKAKRAYISDLKKEMLAAKAGINFNE